MVPSHAPRILCLDLIDRNINSQQLGGIGMGPIGNGASNWSARARKGDGGTEIPPKFPIITFEVDFSIFKPAVGTITLNRIVSYAKDFQRTTDRYLVSSRRYKSIFDSGDIPF